MRPGGENPTPEQIADFGDFIFTLVSSSILFLISIINAFGVTFAAPALNDRPGFEWLARTVLYWGVGVSLFQLLWRLYPDPFAVIVYPPVIVCVFAALDANLRARSLPIIISVVLIVLGFLYSYVPDSLDLSIRAFGALIASGLLAVVALWQRQHSGVTVIGLGDVALAGALGVLLGPGLAAISIAVASFIALDVRGHDKQVAENGSTHLEEPTAPPVGAALALAGVAALIGGRAFGVP